jgi:2-keto-4-pentenoate hydratase/2-oxohepta-3-ene-1,7-dioic acid hydratase in catechol pathway
MRIARFLSQGSIKLGQPLSPSSAHEIIGSLHAGFTRTDQVIPIDQWLSPLIPTDILCIGLNYHAHAKETNSNVPDNPMLFIKASNALSHHGAPIVLPGVSQQVDYEAELVIVMAKDAKNVSRENALDYVLGYTIANDVSARDWQKQPKLNGGQFSRGKSFDSFCPIGPCIVTKDEVPDPNNLRISCTINGQTLQDASTADMIFDVRAIVASLSQTMTVRAGSVILTGTPSGVGVARTPPRWLKSGDVVRIEIEKLSVLENVVV